MEQAKSQGLEGDLELMAEDRDGEVAELSERDIQLAHITVDWNGLNEMVVELEKKHALETEERDGVVVDLARNAVRLVDITTKWNEP